VNVSHFPLLSSLCRQDDALAGLGDSAEAHFAQQQAEAILESLRERPVRGTEKLVFDGAANLPKFLSLLSELRFAHTLASLGADVEVLRDGAYGPGTYAPDLRASFPNKVDLLVEVVRGSSGDPKISKALRAELVDIDAHVAVEEILGEALSTPAADVSGRSKNERLVERVAQVLAERLKNLIDRGTARGIVRIFDGPNGVWCQDVLGEEAFAKRYSEVEFSHDNWVGSFPFQSCASDLALVGGGVTAVRFVDKQPSSGSPRGQAVPQGQTKGCSSPSPPASPFHRRPRERGDGGTIVACSAFRADRVAMLARGSGAPRAHLAG